MDLVTARIRALDLEQRRDGVRELIFEGVMAVWELEKNSLHNTIYTRVHDRIGVEHVTPDAACVATRVATRLSAPRCPQPERSAQVAALRSEIELDGASVSHTN